MSAAFRAADLSSKTYLSRYAALPARRVKQRLRYVAPSVGENATRSASRRPASISLARKQRQHYSTKFVITACEARYLFGCCPAALLRMRWPSFTS